MENNTTNNEQPENSASLQEEIHRLKNYNKALTEEFTKLGGDDDATFKLIKDELQKMVPDATTILSHLLFHGQTDAIRLNAAKFIIAEGLKTSTGEKVKDVLGDLFERLADNDSKEQPNHSEHESN